MLVEESRASADTAGVAARAQFRRADLFATLVPDDTYTVASEIHDLLVKTHAADLEKIELIKELVASNLDIDRILGVATEARFGAN